MPIARSALKLADACRDVFARWHPWSTDTLCRKRRRRVSLQQPSERRLIFRILVPTDNTRPGTVLHRPDIPYFNRIVSTRRAGSSAFSGGPAEPSHERFAWSGFSGRFFAFIQTVISRSSSSSGTHPKCVLSSILSVLSGSTVVARRKRTTFSPAPSRCDDGKINPSSFGSIFSDVTILPTSTARPPTPPRALRLSQFPGRCGRNRRRLDSSLRRYPLRPNVPIGSKSRSDWVR